jgi:hypothetical protein
METVREFRLLSNEYNKFMYESIFIKLHNQRKHYL